MSKEIFLFLDTETTDLLKPLGTDLSLQPYIIEICAIKTDDEFNIIDEFETLIKPPIEIPYFITKHTNISNQMVENKKPFKSHIKRIKKIFENTDTLVAQNLRFDHDLILIEFERNNKKLKMPKRLFCTIEQSMHFKGFRLKSDELNEYSEGTKEIKNHHRAKADVLAMIEYFKFIKNGYIPKHLKVKNV